MAPTYSPSTCCDFSSGWRIPGSTQKHHRKQRPSGRSLALSSDYVALATNPGLGSPAATLNKGSSLLRKEEGLGPPEVQGDSGCRWRACPVPLPPTKLKPPPSPWPRMGMAPYRTVFILALLTIHSPTSPRQPFQIMPPYNISFFIIPQSTPHCTLNKIQAFYDDP